MLLLIDNYDSFTYNLVQYFGELGQQCHVIRNDSISVDEIESIAPTAVVISPGPCTPNEAGISVSAVQQYAGQLPILGVCLGHQSICQAFGGEIVRAERVMHGKTSEIYHQGNGLFNLIENPFSATRYHSLVAQNDSLPDALEVVAWTSEGIIMGVKHKQHHVYGVQFHPESFLTTCGRDILRNFLSLSQIAA